MKRCSTAGLLLLLVCGCSGLDKSAAPMPGVAGQRQDRRETVVQDFEQRRNQAQYLAALTRWQEGDWQGCQLLLESILERHADHQDARRLLAEVCLAQQNPADAERHLRELISREPAHAEAHHSLALLLETSDRSAEAGVYFLQAAQLEPANALYALSAQIGRRP